MGAIQWHALRQSEGHPSADACRQRYSRRNDPDRELVSVSREPSECDAGGVSGRWARRPVPVSRVVHATGIRISRVRLAIHVVLRDRRFQMSPTKDSEAGLLNWDVFVTPGIPIVTRDKPPDVGVTYFQAMAATLIYGLRDA